MRYLPSSVAAGLLAIGTLGCSDGTGPSGGHGHVDLSVMVAQSGAQASAAEETFTLGGNTLVLDRVQLVLREVELKRTRATSSCSSSSGNGSNDDCDEIELGPFLLDLPLGGGITRAVSVEIDTGSYRELEFEIHKPEDDGKDAAFLAEHPDFGRVSIRVEGTFNGTPFVFVSDVNAEQEIDLNPPLVILEAESTNVTLSVDLGAWFLNSTRSTFVDPASANKGGVNENLVKDNLKASFEAFEDHDRNGHS